MITVTAGVFVRDSKVLIGQRKSSGRLSGKWEFPGGKVEGNETAQDCLKRELREELNVDAHIGPLLWKGEHRYNFGTVRLLFFAVQWDGWDVLSYDHDDIQWVPLDKLMEYDFVPGDWPFVEQLAGRGGRFIELLDL